MAPASNSAWLCMLTCQRTGRLAPLPRVSRVARTPRLVATGRRTLSNTAARREGEGDKVAAQDSRKKVRDVVDANKFDIRKGMTPKQLKMVDEVVASSGHYSLDRMLEDGEREKAAEESLEFKKAFQDIELPKFTGRDHIWYDEEEPQDNIGDVDEWDENDITSMAHGRLDEVREMRHYGRLAVWELPLLSKLAKPFEVPTDKQVLRWRYTTYMGEAHPAAKKVVVQFAPDDLKLTPVQTSKLKKLAGARYNPTTELVKMSCESFEHAAQNKRYLSNLVDDLMAAAKDPTDTFEDIPLDTRHHEVKEKPRFPREWYMTPERRQELEAHRQHVALADVKKAETGQLVDGQKMIDAWLEQKAAENAQRSAAESAEAEKVAQTVGAPSKWGGRRGGPRERQGLPRV